MTGTPRSAASGRLRRWRSSSSRARGARLDVGNDGAQRRDPRGPAGGHLAHGLLVGPVGVLDRVDPGADGVGDDVAHDVHRDPPASSWMASTISRTSSTG
jgi:hypothetical protein